MATRTTARQALLPDEVWSGLPRTAADRRTVGAALAVLMLLVGAIAAGSATGILVPDLTYEGGSKTVDARAHTIAIAAVVSNHSARGWRITGATIDAAGTARVVRMSPVDIPAHQRRTIRGVARVESCGAVPAAPDATGYSRSGDMQLHVQRLLVGTSFTIPAVLDDGMIAMACGA